MNFLIVKQRVGVASCSSCVLLTVRRLAVLVAVDVEARRHRDVLDAGRRVDHLDALAVPGARDGAVVLDHVGGRLLGADADELGTLGRLQGRADVAADPGTVHLAVAAAEVGRGDPGRGLIK